MPHALSLARWPLALALLAPLWGCPNTEPPDLGGDPEESGVCTADELAEFQAQSTAPLRTDLWIAFVDVGQGDAIWVRTPGVLGEDAKEILVDAGDTGMGGFRPNGAKALLNFLVESGWLPGARIDYLVVTHPDIDHYGGAAQILRDYEVGAYIDPGKDSTNTTYVSLLGTAEAEPGVAWLRPAWETGIDAKTAGLRETESWGRGLTAELLSADANAAEDNDASIVLRLTFAGLRVLLMGDSETTLDAKLVARYGDDLAAEVLKAGHHGGRTTNSQALLDRVFPGAPLGEPRYAILSAGLRDLLPEGATVERLLAKVGTEGLYRTDRDDALRLAAAEDPMMEAPGDDHVLVRISPDGALRVCYARVDPSAL